MDQEMKKKIRLKKNKQEQRRYWHKSCKKDGEVKLQEGFFHENGYN